MCREPNQACHRGEWGRVLACELKPFSQGGIEGGFGQCWGPLTASEMGRPSEEGKGGRVFPAKVVTMVMGQDHAWGEATGQPKLKEARFP